MGPLTSPGNIFRLNMFPKFMLWIPHPQSVWWEYETFLTPFMLPFTRWSCKRLFNAIALDEKPCWLHRLWWHGEWWCSFASARHTFFGGKQQPQSEIPHVALYGAPTWKRVPCLGLTNTSPVVAARHLPSTTQCQNETHKEDILFPAT